jgi:signal transduction histidine kinase
MTMKSIKTVLLIEDNPGDARLVRETLSEQGPHNTALIHVGCMSEAETYLAEHSVDVILLDPGLPDAQGLGAMRRARAAAPAATLVVLTHFDDESLASQALQEGAQDYLVKGQIETRGLLRALRYAVERKRLERLKDEFVSTVSHELRTPLTSISGSLALLVGQWGGKLPEPAVRLLVIAHKNSQRLVRLVNDILDIEKIESGRVVFKLERVDVRPLVEQAIESNRGFAEGYGVRVRLDTAAADGEVNADPDRLAQVITNLLSNAIKFSPADKEVLVAIAKSGDIVRISVRDHGPGIPAEFKPHVFEKFAQADATNSRQKGGTGLGLSIVKQIVERLGGRVRFADASGGGTIFHVELPAWDTAADRETALEAEAAIPRILHLDDDHDVLAAVAAAFGTTADVISVDCIEDACRALATNRIDLAVLDISLGTASVMELLPDLHDSQGDVIPAIIFAARGRDMACDDQIQATLTKSQTSIESLVATIHDRLAHLPARTSTEAA